MTTSAETPAPSNEPRHSTTSERAGRPQLDSASVSVVVPTFNDVGRLGDALHSIVGQTAAPAEVVVADDGSTDGTELFVAEFAERRARGVEIRYVRLPSRSGVVAARNAGIAATRGEWIATCDSDDVWAAEKLERQIRFANEWSGQRRIALMGTHGYNMNDAKKVVSPAIMGPTSEADYEHQRRTGTGFYLLHSSALYPRSDYLAVGGYTTEYGAADDFDFFCQMAERGVVVVVSEPLVYYRKRAGSVQLARFWDKQSGALRVVENQRRRATGEPLVSREEFAAQLARASIRDRLRRHRRTLGLYYYRSGAANIVNGRRVRGALQLLVASTLDWARVRAAARNVARGRLRPS